jgi:HEAT repeat protein
VPELIRALAIAWKNLAAYPAGHPALATSMALAHQRLARMFASAGPVTIGVTRDGLVCGEETLSSPHARDLAHALYLREVALLVLEPGLEASELETLLRLVHLEPGRTDAPALAPQLAAAGVTHARVAGIDFSRVRATDALDESPVSATLWDDLRRAALTAHEPSPEGPRAMTSAETATPRGLAEILHEALGGGSAGADPAERSALTGRLAEAMGRHFAGSAQERRTAAGQVADLVRALPEDLKDVLVSAAMKALASDESAGKALQAVAESTKPDTILQALRQIKEEVPLSSHALRLLHALGAAAPPKAAPTVEAPDPELMAELSVLFLEEDVDRYNPEDHKALLTECALTVPGTPHPPRDLGERLHSLTDDVVADHMAQAAVEMLGRLGGREGTDALVGRLEGVFREALARGQVETSVALAEDLKALGEERPLRAAVQAHVDEVLARMANTESLRAVVEAMTQRGAVSAALAHRLMDALGEAAARGFLVALAEEPDKSRRRRLLDMLVQQGSVIAGPAREMLGDDRWYVVRNMLLILQKVGDRAALPRVRLCATAHPDLRVRLEAIKFLLAFDPETPRAMLAEAIHDPDPKMAEAAVTLAGSYGIREAVEPLLDIVDRFDLMRRRQSIRLKAIKALGELGDPAALPRLGRYFRASILPLVARIERRAAYRSLHSYPAAARAALVERGARSGDAEIRRICLGLLREGEAGARRAADA